MAVTSKGGTPVLGLDIGAAFIKAVELRPSKGALAITGVGVLPTPPGCIVNDEIVDPVVLAQAVKQLLSECNIKTKDVISSVAGQSSVVVRVIEVPRMNDKELAETMRWEIDRHIPFAPEEVVKDFSPITRPNDDPNSANMSVLLAVAQNNLVSGMLQTVVGAGLTPVAIDVELLAGARTVFDVDDAHLGDTVALVNVGATKTDVAIFEAGSLAFPRTIPLAGNAMTESIARALNVDIADAERLKKQHGVVPADAVDRFGSRSQTPEETFTFGDFGGPAMDFSAPGGATFAEPAPGGFAATPEGPVFGSPFAATPEGPVFEEPAFGAPGAGAAPAPPEPYQPTYDAPAFDAPTFDAPAFAAPAYGQTADGPGFDVPGMDTAPAVPVAPVVEGTADLPTEGSDTPPVTAPVETAPLTPNEAPLRAPAVPEVISEGERHRKEISDAFMPVVAELTQEIKRSLEYYSTRANNASVARLLLYGGTANLPGLTSFLEAELGLPVQAVGLPNSVSLSGGAVSTDYVQQVSVMLPVALGLAARNAIAGPPAASGKSR